MKFLGYVIRNARRNPVRSLLTSGSVAVCLALMMILLTFLSINSSVAESLRRTNRLVVMSSQGFAQPVPIGRVGEVAAMDGMVAAIPRIWYGGKYGEEVMPFAQFGTDAEKFFAVYDELTIPPDQLKAWQKDRAGCVVGRKLAEDLKLKVGDLLPLKGVLYPFDLNLAIRGIYDGPPNSGRWCIFHWDYLEEGLKRGFGGKGAGNAGLILAKVKSGALIPVLARKIDETYRPSDAPTRTQTEAAFSAMIAEMWGDLRGFIGDVGLAVIFALICVVGNAMAMAMRERTTEVAVLKAIGFGKSLIVSLVLTESVLVSGLGGVFGALGSKLLFDLFDIAPYTTGFLSSFSVPWPTALLGLAASLLIGFASGIIPAVRAAQPSVVTGLRKVV